MIDKAEIEAKAKEFEIGVADVERDYVFGWLLFAIYTSTSLKDMLILKGGAAFRKTYFETTRYTGDLDFATTQKVDPQVLEAELNRACELAQQLSGVTFATDRTRVDVKRMVQAARDQERMIYEVRIYFQDFYGRPGAFLISVRMDVTELDRIVLPIQTRNLIHPYSDFKNCNAAIRCVKVEELLASKLKCLLQRRRASDLYDYVYSIFIKHEIAVDRREIVNTFLDKTIFRPAPSAAKGLLLGLPFPKFSELWSKFITCPKQVRIHFEDGIIRFREHLEELFSEFGTSHRELAFFPAELRNPIMDAGASQTLMRLTYSNVERMVEPYSLAFKRTKDGVGQEYLYAYDRTGGQESGPSIKTFVAARIQQLEPTDEKFEPRFPVELSKAGEPSSKSYFGKPFGRSTNSRRESVSRVKRTRTGIFGRTTVYVIECRYCSKRFEHRTRSTRLRAHKDKYGNRCLGRSGTLVDQR